MVSRIPHTSLWSSYYYSYSLSKWISLCLLNGAIGSPPPLQIMLIVWSNTVVVFWACNLISFKHMSFWYPFLKPHHSTYHADVSVLLRKVNWISYLPHINHPKYTVQLNSNNQQTCQSQNPMCAPLECLKASQTSKVCNKLGADYLSKCNDVKRLIEKTSYWWCMYEMRLIGFWPQLEQCRGCMLIHELRQGQFWSWFSNLRGPCTSFPVDSHVGCHDKCAHTLACGLFWSYYVTRRSLL